MLKVFLLQIWFIAEAPGCCQACSGGCHVSSQWGNCCPVSSTVQISEQSCGFRLGGSPLVTSPMAWRTKSWTQAGSLICKWVCLRNTHWEKVNLFLYKAEYLCTVNKYITNLSCLKKVLPFWCLFPKLIYKNVLCLLVFLLSSMHIIAFGLKIRLWKKNQLSTSLLSGVSPPTLQQHTRKHWPGGSWGGLCWVSRWVPIKSIPYWTAFLLVFLR